ncbi:Sodium- and chloride-dependent taurine transporter [Mytilus edulis]|uniref:Sodium- and chloride-dependent taurine transporter n=1 Tax=Mytilus edulis TaxID=6550 RepID=A0A8S3Q0W3_MYTED|nr:Sodium- and chloride-dependent taurine transporter [Mytilus edulis]
MEVKEKHDFDLEDEDKVHIETDSISEESSEEDREQWDKKIEFILSMLGYIVGLGNFWRFPYLCMRNGGGECLSIPVHYLLHFHSVSVVFPGGVTWTVHSTEHSPMLGGMSFIQRYKVLDMSKGIEEMGSLNLNILICLLVSWVVLFLCLMKGIKSVGKVVYVTATLPYILMIILLVRGLTLPGAMNGIRYYIYPNFTRIGDPKVWIEAAIQVFYSTCVCWGPLITMASYNKFNNNCLRDSAMLITMGEGFSVFGGFVVFSVLGLWHISNGVEIEDVVKSGPGLIYIAYPEVVAKLPLPNLWAVIFFIMILTIGLDSQGGIYVFQLMDWYIAAFCIPIFGIIECLVFGWIYGADNFSRDIELMIGRPIPIVIRILWCFVTPVLLFILLIMIVVRYESPTYGEYSYPLLANVFGFTYALVPLLPVIICAVITVLQSDGNSVLEKFRNSLRPTMLWQPGDKNERKRYMEMDVIDTQTFSERISLTLLGR